MTTMTSYAKDNFEGVASYYADMFVGRTTANGERYTHKKMTCAHKTLPFGTVLRVTNLTNHKSVIVTVNDRGPFVKGRIVDLSKSAAEAINMVNSGVAKVAVEIIDKDENSYLLDEETEDISTEQEVEAKIDKNCSELSDLSCLF